MTENDNVGKVRSVSDIDLVALLRDRVEVPLDEMGGSGDVSPRRMSEIRLILRVLRDLNLLEPDELAYYEGLIEEYEFSLDEEDE